MKDNITFLDNNGKSYFSTGGNIHGIYSYLDIIGASTTLTTSVHYAHNFGTLSSINNDTESIHPVVTDLRMR